ncbi:hypothetical protein Aperf_G00000103755 [Anoplocephala perfoliata]
MCSPVSAEFMGSNDSISGLADQLPLSPSKVRWFYTDETTKKWTPFNGYDSIKIELNYVRLLNCRTEYSDKAEKSKPLVVRDGLYEVDVPTKRCYPIYWDSHSGPASILRGVWFKEPAGPNPIPIEDESMVEQLESTYAMLYHRLLATESTHSGSVSPKLDADEDSGADTPATAVSVSSNSIRHACVHTLKFSDCHVDWYSLDELYLYMESTTFYIRQTLGLQKVGIRLGRGYFEEADLHTPPPVYSHLVFVVHGIGQKFLKGSIITACDGESVLCLVEFQAVSDWTSQHGFVTLVLR